MALFQKKPQTSNSAPLYTLGLSKTILVVGLGNPGREFDHTRHNVGFACVEEFVKSQDFGGWIEKKDQKCLHSSGTIGGTRVIVIKPATYMNNSGEAIQAVMHFYKLTPGNIIVVHDELTINFGQIRMRTGGSDAGHNGVKSLIEHLGEEFNRVRVGIGKDQDSRIPDADYVLAKFNKDEMDQMPNLTREVNSILTEFVAGGSLPHDTRNFII